MYKGYTKYKIRYRTSIGEKDCSTDADSPEATKEKFLDEKGYSYSILEAYE